jgi:hypothetical protein
MKLTNILSNTSPNYHKVQSATIREYHGTSPCLPNDVMYYLQDTLRPWNKSSGFVRLRPAVYPNGASQYELPLDFNLADTEPSGLFSMQAMRLFPFSKI